MRTITATIEEWRIVYLNFTRREQTADNIATHETIKASIKEYGDTTIENIPEHIANEIETILEENWI